MNEPTRLRLSAQPPRLGQGGEANRRPTNSAGKFKLTHYPEFLTEVLEALLAVILPAQTRLETFGARVAFVTLAGILAALPTNVSYWNWYGFPTNYTASYMFIQFVGFFLVGIVAAIMFRRVTA